MGIGPVQVRVQVPAVHPSRDHWVSGLRLQVGTATVTGTVTVTVRATVKACRRTRTAVQSPLHTMVGTGTGIVIATAIGIGSGIGSGIHFLAHRPVRDYHNVYPHPRVDARPIRTWTIRRAGIPQMLVVV